MTKNKFSTHFLSIATLTVAILLGIAIPPKIQAQPVLGAQNTALGGGGTAYLTGTEATFWNPANLSIRDQINLFHIGLGHAGILNEPVLSSDAANDQFLNFTDVYDPYQSSVAQISEVQRETILDNNYPANKLSSQHQTRADVILGGILWQRNGAAFSLAARARFASRIEVGRGWYSDEFIESGDEEVRDFTLHQQRNYLYELSFGYARKFTFINGLFSNLNKLHVGIAPKLVLAGPNLDMNYEGRYIRVEDGSNEVYAQHFNYSSSGSFSQATQEYRSGGNPQQAVQNNFNRQPSLDNSGYGAGFDFGLTYLIPLGDDLSTIADNPEESVVTKSLRIAFSVNDIGIVRYNDNPLQLSMPKDTVSETQQAPSETMFIGAAGQYLHYFDSASNLSTPFLESSVSDKNSHTTLLPTSVNTGILLEIPQIKLMGDLTLGLNNTAFTTTKLVAHLGLETRPIQKIPIRFGTRLAAGKPTRLGTGIGFETAYWDFNIGGQILLRSQTFTSEVAGGAFAGIQLHL